MLKHNARHIRLPFAMLFLIASLFSARLAAMPDAPALLTGSITDTSVTLDWQSVDGALGYNVYENNSYLTTVFSTDYQGAVDIGSVYNYYVVAFSDSPRLFSAHSNQLTLPASAVPSDTTIPPTIPDGLQGDITDGVTSLVWNPSTDDEAVFGYNVYQNNQYLSTVFDTQFSIPVINGQSYVYSIVAFDARQNFSPASDKITLPESLEPVDTTIAPSTVQGLSGAITNTAGESSVALTWQESTDDQSVAGYNVYQNNAYINTVSNTEFSVNVVPDTVYSYYIVAFDFDGNFAKPSSALVLPDGIEIAEDTQPPTTPAELIGQYNDNGTSATISLSWQASADDGTVAGYNIYENKNYLTTVSTTTFEKQVNSGISHSYSIVAFDVARNFSLPSNRVTLPKGDNRAPFFTDLANQHIFAGATLDLLIAPSDIDSPTPGLFVGTLPVGMQSVDNLDGTRTLRWHPLQPDVGTYDIQVTAFDATDPGIQTTETFRLTVELPADLTTIENLPPAIDSIDQHIVRVGDTVIMEVKATDRNGTVPYLSLINSPAGASFTPHPTEPRINVLRWTTGAADFGLNELQFEAVDAEDESLRAQRSVLLEVADASQFEREGERLRNLADERDFKIGYASLLKYYNRPDSDLYQSIVREEFNLVTAENSMKWGYINPQPGEYRFDAADTLVEFSIANDMQLHGHTLVWYSSLPQWVQQSAVGDRESLMYDFIDTMTARYNTVAIWDVVNEAFADDGSYRDSVWYQAMGADHIAKAFTRARAGAPSAKLIYNDYDIAFGGAKTEAVYTLMLDLLADGIPVDGIGFQMHLDTDFKKFNEITTTMERFANLGLEIYITELDVSMQAESTEAEQAIVYANVLAACLAQEKCKSLQVWGVADHYSWRKDDLPLLLDRNYRAKPAYTALQNTFVGNN